MTDESPVSVAVENRLMSHGIYVIECRHNSGGPVTDGTDLELEYETVADAPVVTSDEVGAVVRTLLAVADERDWTPGRLEATSLSIDGEVRGSWHVEASWFDRLPDDLSEGEFSQRVLETVSTTRD
ncbi:hypothetical protein [Natronobacterium gregoryi]|uniref:DUF8159 domain-containing protein n=2 Tax=Natronobacterium gregoryi TaxID=44930 RepID=L0ALE2_NATGS|nr:hypothetical protein [Natronobacterium gregoryi]AFZ74708.1 hypothetical protein Natgr_3594 [Natronobacterium gregoryi SP2]ELY73387.1 hypothetical protein C490_01440 [Natronobacterium gregoryi SP2]PLK20952.1 hypothetical protein CYV19_06735 [Natronobacterium gregoryi SP2]SFJ04380.1 hypothetical protein SAMN05443661_11250 [Natronobacterium gregoryi]